MNRQSTLRLALIGSTLLLAVAPLLSADGRRLSVIGTGRVDVRPDVMELTATVTGSAEMTANALKKFRESRRRGVEALNKLKIKGIDVRGSGISVISNAAVQQYQQMFGNVNQQTSPGHTTFSETLKVTVPGIDHLSDDEVQDLATKILDAAKDAGLSIGQSVDPYRRYYDSNSYHPQIVCFRVNHTEDARQKALDLAAQDAQKKAEQMAKRLGLHLGKPASARDATSRQANVVVQNSSARNDESPGSETSVTLHSIAVEAILSIDYEVGN